MANLGDLFLSYNQFPQNNISSEKRSKLDNLRDFLVYKNYPNNIPGVVYEGSNENVIKAFSGKLPNESYFSFGDNSQSKKDLIKHYFDYFINKGLTPNQTAGILGNILRESSGNAGAVNKEEKEAGLSGHGEGLIQWSNSRKKDFKDWAGHPLSESTANEQLEFIWHELTERPKCFKLLKESRTVEEASDYIHRGLVNGSKYALTSPQQMQETYQESWQNLGYGDYNFYEQKAITAKKSNDALKIYMEYGQNLS